MNKFRSTKLIDGFSTCFRQWKSAPIHCALLHGYGLSFKVTFEGELDRRNWVADFGFMKRSTTKMPVYARDGEKVMQVLSPDAWFKYWFDHTVVISDDDPASDLFDKLHDSGVANVRTLPQVGCEMFAKFVFDSLNEFLYKETQDRVRVVQVECFEHDKNSAIYTSL